MFRPMLAATLLLTASACGALTEDDEPKATDSAAPITNVVLVTHESFALPEELVTAWEQETGYHLVQRASGDAGELTNKLVLTKSSPTGDVAFGVDNSFAGRALAEGVFAPYGGTLPAGTEDFALAEGSDRLVPIDNGDVCVNVDKAWYADHGQTPPATLDDLLDPAYKGQFVTPGAPTSSPGFAFLLATIAAKGDGWTDYWTALMANDAKVVAGWEDAYFVDFTAGGGKAASRPIVLSYDSSPAFTIDKKTGESTTAALLDTCTRQVEYAGVLEGARNVSGATALIDFLLSPEVQAALPTSMYVFPVVDGTPLPADWARHATRPTTTLDVAPAEIEANRDEWLADWTDIATR